MNEISSPRNIAGTHDNQSKTKNKFKTPRDCLPQDLVPTLRMGIRGHQCTKNDGHHESVMQQCRCLPLVGSAADQGVGRWTQDAADWRFEGCSGEVRDLHRHRWDIVIGSGGRRRNRILGIVFYGCKRKEVVRSGLLAQLDRSRRRSRAKLWLESQAVGEPRSVQTRKLDLATELVILWPAIENHFYIYIYIYIYMQSSSLESARDI